MGLETNCKPGAMRLALAWNGPLLAHREEVAFIRLVVKSWEMMACEGRQCSCEDYEVMDSYEERLRGSLNEDSLRNVIDDFGRRTWCLQGDPLEVDPRSLLWTEEKKLATHESSGIAQ